MRRHLMTSPASALVVLAVLLMQGGAFGAPEDYDTDTINQFVEDNGLEELEDALNEFNDATSGTRPHPPG
jgi:hypothetical protein